MSTSMAPDTSIFDQYFLENHDHVYRTLYRVLGDAQESEDLVQEVFLRLHETLHQTELSNPRAWLTQVALHTALNALRSRQRRNHRHDQAAKHNLHEMTQKPELALSVRKVLFEELPDKQANLLVLHAAGLQYEEIADLLDVQRSSISQLLVRAKRAFTAAYQADRDL